MLQPSSRPDPSRCPLCGADNRCAMEMARPEGAEPPNCWCMTVDFDPALQDSLAPEARGLACICARCVSSAHD